MPAPRRRRAYDMRRRGAAAARTRQAVVDAVHRQLEASDAGRLTLDEVAQSAGVTRATIYNQFGSRRALLTAAFADQGRLVRYDRVIAATAVADAHEALESTLREVCRAWEARPKAIQRVLALAVLDPEIGAVVDRYERARRGQMRSLARRLGSPAGSAAAAAMLGALTSPLAYYQFRAGAGPRAAARLLRQAVRAAFGLDRVPRSRR